MSQIQSLHQQAMDLAEAAAVARLRGALEEATQFTRQAFEQETQAAERLIATALSGNPPVEIAEELKDLFIQINLSQYLKRQGIDIDINELREFVNH
ncbi:hypothetical protein LEP3755_54270 [Leptolyngbya sp. NIES-3755]|nr:hypothetical protein LEP3755_54270 [Leptolyngbya sp. NIES-3755]